MPPREKIERDAADPSYRPHPIGDTPREEATTRGPYIYIYIYLVFISRIRSDRPRILISIGYNMIQIWIKSTKLHRPIRSHEMSA